MLRISLKLACKILILTKKKACGLTLQYYKVIKWLGGIFRSKQISNCGARRFESIGAVFVQLHVDLPKNVFFDANVCLSVSDRRRFKIANY